VARINPITDTPAIHTSNCALLIDLSYKTTGIVVFGILALNHIEKVIHRTQGREEYTTSHVTSFPKSFHYYSYGTVLHHVLAHGQVCVMIHTGSRGLGHQVASEALQTMDKAMYLMVLNQMILNFHALE
jgi:hypothetical protein